MFDKLIVDAFEKAKKEINSEVVSQMSNHISEVILEEFKFQISERTLRNYYNKIKKEQEQEDISMSSQISLHLARYLGYKDFKEFITVNSENPESNSKSVTKNFLSFKVIASSIIIALASFLVYNSFKKECMIWVDKGHYEYVSCEEGIQSGAILYNEVVFDKMKRIDPGCDYPFFNPDGSANLWYSKGKEENIEFFTHHGIHPVYNKTLKPVTSYIIDKYICKIQT